MTHREILEMWPSYQTIATDLDEKYNTVMRWKSRGSIPADKWVALVDSAIKHDVPLSYRMLAEAIAA